MPVSSSESIIRDKDGFLPSPFVVLAAIAARTSRIRVGTAVLLLPLHHPVRVAEEAAVLDIVSGGRTVLGVGLGYQDADFRAAGIDRRERVPRFEESVAILRQAWTGEPVRHRSRSFEIDGVRVTPPPLQKPGIPIWVGGWVPAAVERAGRLGDALVLGPSFTLEENRALADRYRAAAEAAGRVPQLVLMRDAWVADSFEQAARIYGPEVSAAYGYYWRNGATAFRGFASEAELRFENYLEGPDHRRRAGNLHRRVQALVGRPRREQLRPPAPARPLRRPAAPRDRNGHRTLRPGCNPVSLEALPARIGRNPPLVLASKRIAGAYLARISGRRFRDPCLACRTC